MSAFEPGSVQKAITFAAALQERLITPKTVLTVPRPIRMGGVTVSDAWYHPTEQFTATGVLAESSNVGTLKIAQKIGPTRWYDYEKAFGVGHEDRHRAAGREQRLRAAAVGVVGLDLRQPAVRAGREHDRAAARLDLPDHRQRRRADPAADRSVGDQGRRLGDRHDPAERHPGRSRRPRPRRCARCSSR